MPGVPPRFLARLKKKGLIIGASLTFLSLFPANVLNSEQIIYGLNEALPAPQHIDPSNPGTEIKTDEGASAVFVPGNGGEGGAPEEPTPVSDPVKAPGRSRYGPYIDKGLDPAVHEEMVSRLEPIHIPYPSGRSPQKEAPADVVRGDTALKLLSITFDGGFEADDAGAILDALKARDIRTTVFLTGYFIKAYPEIVRRIVSDGHEVGNHTMNHPRLTEYERTRRQKRLPWVDREFVVRELKEVESLFRRTTGKEMAPLWRAPYGEENSEIRGWAFEAGYLHIGWTSDPRRRESLDTLDWVHQRSSRLYRTQDAIREKIVNFNKDGPGLRGGIILMHLGTERKSDKAAGVLGDMLDAVMGNGYRFVKITNLIEGNANLALLKRERAWRVTDALTGDAPPSAYPDGVVIGDKARGFK